MRPERRTAGQRDLDVLVVGDLNPDVIVVDDADPRPSFWQVETVVESIVLTVGGSSAIFACGAARLGLRVALVALVGDDAAGRFMLQEVAARGVDVTGCIVDPGVHTGASVVIGSGPGRAILTSLGAIEQLRVDHVSVTLMARARHLHVGSTYLQHALRPRLPELFRAARAAGLSVSFDCNWDPAGQWNGSIDELLREADLFLLNAEEARCLTGRTDEHEAAAELVRRSVRGGSRRSLTVVVKRGGAGALAVSGNRTVSRPALPVVVRDTTGAGDSLAAGMVYGWLAGWSIADALELAVVCGSLACRDFGGTASQPTLEEAQRALAATRAGSSRGWFRSGT